MASDLGYTEPTVAAMIGQWFGVVVPVKTPLQIIAFLNERINAILAEPKTIAQLRDLNIEPRRLTPDAIQKMVREESAFFADLIRVARIRVECWTQPKEPALRD